jgi:lipoic acid synthetase
VQRYYTPDEFAELKAIGEDVGFRHVEAGPLVRSSYHARQQVEELKRIKRLERGASPAS